MLSLILFWQFAKFSMICFGGGYMLIPLLISTFVGDQKLLTMAEFGNLLAVAQITPGPVGINAATYVGYLEAGVSGAAAATVGMVVPTLILGCAAVIGMRRWKNSAWLNAALNGIRIAALALVWFAVLLFLGISVFTAPIPWADLCRFHWPEEFGISPAGLVICAVTVVLLRLTRIPFVLLIVLAAAAGAFFCR